MTSSRKRKRPAGATSGGTFESELELDVERLVYGPGALSHAPDGRVVLLDQGLPGERVRVRVDEERRDYLRASVLRYLDPASPDRRAPPCEVVGLCGGCPWQVLDYEKQVAAKQEIVLAELQRVCGVRPHQTRPALVAGPWQGRHRIRLAVDARSLAGSAPRVGYRPRRSRDVVPIESCPIARPELSEALPLARGLAERLPRLREIELSIDDRKGLRLWGRCHSARPRATDGLWGELQAEAAAGLGASFGLVGMTLVGDSGRDRWRVDLGDVAQRIRVAPGIEIGVPLGCFSQVNLELNRQLVAAVVEALEGPADRFLLDLYCGAGNFSLPLAAAGARVLGVDADVRAIESASASAVASSLTDRVRFIAGSADSSALTGLDETPYAVVLDPPRAGAAAVLPGLLDLAPARIAYVSCDLATFCRDARTILARGWDLSSLQILDLTPHSYRAEILGVFRLT